MTEAGKGKIGTPVDQVILFCYHYDPQKGTYGIAIFRVIQVACFSTMFLLGMFIVPALIKDAKTPKIMAGDIQKDEA